LSTIVWRAFRAGSSRARKRFQEAEEDILAQVAAGVLDPAAVEPLDPVPSIRVEVAELALSPMILGQLLGMVEDRHGPRGRVVKKVAVVEVPLVAQMPEALR